MTFASHSQLIILLANKGKFKTGTSVYINPKMFFSFDKYYKSILDRKKENPRKLID